MPFHVLVLDAKQRSALAVTRSLGRLPDVRVTTADAASEALAGCSRFSSHYICSPSAEHEPSAYIQWLAAHLASQHYDLVLPVTEITSQLLLMNHQHFDHLPLPFADYATVMQLADKGELVKLAQQSGIPCPKSRWFASAAELDVAAERNFPIVIKPCLSKIYVDNTWVATRVCVIFSQAELLQELHASAYLQSTPFMLQEFIPGHGAGVFCLYDRGEPLAFFAHERLREKPPEGGVSVLCESRAVDPVMSGYASKLLGAVKWHGVAMVEFRVSPSGEAYLMEVNTRFWGSLQLSIDSGVDFPRLLWQAELARTGRGATVAAQVGRADGENKEYRVGQRLRWLLGDFDSLYLYIKGGYSPKQKLRRVLAFFTPRWRHCRHEVNRWGDLGPARHELVLYIKQLLGRE
jgi:predicted ATP-grasp superfamily ATP-dependent carboligase